VNGTIQFSGIAWNKIDWNWNAGLYSANVLQDGGNLVLRVNKGSGIGAQIQSVTSDYHYGEYKALIKAAPSMTSPEGVCQGFFYNWSDPQNRKNYQEIDIEILSKDPGYVHFVVHQGGEYFRIPVSNQSSQFHEYGFRWYPGRVEFILDGTVVATTTQNIPTEPGTLIINNWSGDTWAGDPLQGMGNLDMSIQSISYSPITLLQNIRFRYFLWEQYSSFR